VVRKDKKYVKKLNAYTLRKYILRNKKLPSYLSYNGLNSETKRFYDSVVRIEHIDNWRNYVRFDTPCKSQRDKNKALY